MANYKTAKNLLGNRDTYSKYYGDFRGVDLSSDHTLVNERRFSYAVNMYKDYLSGQATGIETVPGFRKRVVIPDSSEIYGIHYFRHKDAQGNMLEKILIHAGKKLYLWSGYPLTAGVLLSGIAYIKKPDATGDIDFTIDLSKYNVGTLVSVSVGSDNKITAYTLSDDKKELSFRSYYTSYSDGDPVEIMYYESELTAFEQEMNSRKSVSFMFNNLLYIIDGKSYLVYDGSSVSNVLDRSFVPTTRARMVPAGSNDQIAFTVDGTEYYAKSGMTWWGFINSHYSENLKLIKKDTDIYTFSSDKIYKKGYYKAVCDESGNQVKDSDTITDGAKYTLTESVEVDIISFYLEGKKYYAESGMTWKEVVNSHYNEELRLYGIYPAYGYVLRSSVCNSYDEGFDGDIVAVRTEDSVDGLDGDPVGIYDLIKQEEKYIICEAYGEYMGGIDRGYAVYTDADAVIPTISEANADAGIELYQRNLLSNKIKNTFIATGDAARYYLSENNIDKDAAVTVFAYGVEIPATHYTVNRTLGYVFVSQKAAEQYLQAPESKGFPEEYAGIEIIFEKRIKSAAGVTLTDEEKGISIDASSLITGCTLATIYDGRVFLSGNPLCPNTIFWCGTNDTGHIDPTYFGILNNQTDGFGIASIVGMMPVSDTLLVLKADSLQDGCVYFHTPYETGDGVIPTTYPSTQGLNGVGCLGAYTNFLDDPVFISRLGLEAIGQLSVRLERGREHRSSLIDAELLKCDLSKAAVEEWNGYLFVLAGGKIFLADSRQRFANELGNAEYEWYYLEDIGVYDGQYHAYRFASELPPVLEGATAYGMPLEIASEVYDPDTNEFISFVGRIANNDPKVTIHEGTAEGRVVGFDDEYNEIISDVTFPYVIYTSTDPDGNDVSRAFLVEESDEYIGGSFKPAVMLKAIGDNIYFGTQNGVVCSFNFDMRDESGVMPTSAYTFDGRAIFSGCATKMDNCGIPHLTKTTVKKSTVIKLGALDATAAKIKVRTNREPYKQIARINSSAFSFDDLDFSDISFLTESQSLFTVKEKEKKWVEKQYFIYSDEYKKPFALFYAAYRYYIAGRYKNQ